MRPPLKIRRTWAKHRYDSARIDRATGEVLEYEIPIVWERCKVCGWVGELDFGEHAYDECGYGRSFDGVLWDEDDEARWYPVREDGLVLYQPEPAVERK
jgi:hypothetical protein